MSPTEKEPVKPWNLDWFIDEVANHCDWSAQMLDPVKMLAELRAYETIRAIAATDTEADEEREPWQDWLEDADIFARLVDLAGQCKDAAGLEGYQEAAFEYFYYSHGNSETTAYDDRVWGEVEAFIESPTPEVAKRNPVLQKWPDACAVVRGFKHASRYQLAAMILKHRPAPLVLRVPLSPATMAALSPPLSGSLELWIWVAGDSNNIEMDRPDIYEINAVLLNQEAQHSEITAVAAMVGKYIPTARHDSASLFEIMDAHSQDLNDVWKAIQGEFLPRAGLESLEDVADRFDDGIGPGICIPLIIVADSYRGRGLSKLLFQAVAEVCSHAPWFEMAGTNAEDAGDGMNKGDELTYEGSDLAEELTLNPIRLYVLAVEGTRPKGVQYANPLERSNLSKVARQPVVEFEAERGRRALNRHFMKIGKDSTDFYLHCYNPWDYPTT